MNESLMVGIGIPILILWVTACIWLTNFLDWKYTKVPTYFINALMFIIALMPLWVTLIVEGLTQ